MKKQEQWHTTVATDVGNCIMMNREYQSLKESALTVPALGHAWESDYTIDKPATKNTAGEKSIHCMRCDARTDIQTIPATGGSDDQNGSDSNSGNNNSGTSGEDSSGSNTSTKRNIRKRQKVTVKGIRYKVTGVVAKTKKFEVSCTEVHQKDNKIVNT